MNHAEEILRKAADLYAERNAVYKDNYRTVGRVMEALFPDGLDIKGDEEFNRMHIFELIIVKLTRYVANWSDNGHEDSLQDMIVYLSILGMIDKENESQGPASGLPEPAKVRYANLSKEGELLTEGRVFRPVKDSPQA